MLNRGKTGPRRSATIGDRRGGCSHRVVERRRQSRRVVVEANRRCEIGIKILNLHCTQSFHRLNPAQHTCYNQIIYQNKIADPDLSSQRCSVRLYSCTKEATASH